MKGIRIGAVVAALRESRGMTRVDLAAKCGMAIHAIDVANWEMGLTDVPIHLVAEALGVRPGLLKSEAQADD